MKKSVTLKIVTYVILGLLIFVAFVKFEYGTGKEYPDLGANLPTESFVLEKLIQLDYPIKLTGQLDVALYISFSFNETCSKV